MASQNAPKLGLGGVLERLEGVLVSWGRLESFVERLGGVLGGVFGRLETIPRCANKVVTCFQNGRASAASERAQRAKRAERPGA